MRHGPRWVRVLLGAWHHHCAALTLAPDPHGQFPALPLDWYRHGEPDLVRVPAQRTGPPPEPGHRG